MIVVIYQMMRFHLVKTIIYCYSPSSACHRSMPAPHAHGSVYQWGMSVIAFSAWLLALISTSLMAETNDENMTQSFRIATFNTSLHRSGPGDLLSELRNSSIDNNPHPQIKKIAEIIRHVRPHVILLNEFDHPCPVPGDSSDCHADEAIELFKHHYLKPSLASGTDPITYSWHFAAGSNTGTAAGVDLNNDAAVNEDDVFGFGAFSGQYGMAVLSQFPLINKEIRTFQQFLWRDMPDALWPMVTDEDNKPKHYYSDAARKVFRLSSKSHWDIPINVEDTVIHLLASHPTPPVFDGEEDRNGRRNHDEIRFWADYVDAQDNSYIYDDMKRSGGLPTNRRFVILGDLNASPDEGDATNGAIDQLLQHTAVNASFTPVSEGAVDNAPDNTFASSHTATWALRVDYVLPSSRGLDIVDGAVFWPSQSELPYQWYNVGDPGTDHRLVWLDLKVTAMKDR